MAFLADIELDLESYSGPFDLLLSLILRDEVDLLEIQLAEVIVTYLDVLQARGELDLDAATEFLVLIAALLELKSRLMLPPVEGEDEEDLAPEEAAEELVRRMLEARRYRSAAEHLRERLSGETGIRYRQAALPRHLRDTQTGELPAGSYRAARLGRAIGELLRTPKSIDLGHVAVARVTVDQRLAHLRGLLRRASRMSFDTPGFSARRPSGHGSWTSRIRRRRCRRRAGRSRARCTSSTRARRWRRSSSGP